MKRQAQLPGSHPSSTIEFRPKVVFLFFWFLLLHHGEDSWKSKDDSATGDPRLVSNLKTTCIPYVEQWLEAARGSCCWKCWYFCPGTIKMLSVLFNSHVVEFSSAKKIFFPFPLLLTIFHLCSSFASSSRCPLARIQFGLSLNETRITVAFLRVLRSPHTFSWSGHFEAILQ